MVTKKVTIVNPTGLHMRPVSVFCKEAVKYKSQIFIHFKDGKKVSEFLSKAKKIADFSLSNQKNLGLFIDILNFYLYYIEVDEENIVGIKKEQIEEIVEYIQNFIVTIKNDKNSDVDIKFLGNIEKYLGKTINIIIERKNKKNCKDIYKNIVIDYADNKN